MKVVVLSGWVDGTDTSESYLAFKWIEALGRIHDVTLLCFQRHGRLPTAEQLPHVRVVSWPEPRFLERVERIRAQVKPHWPLLTRHARRWLRERMQAGEYFDIAHQLYPAAMRHSSPFRDLPIPYVIGPLAGSLATPEAFQGEVETGGMAARLRKLDGFRFRHDNGLRSSFSQADAVIGAGSYVKDVMADILVRRFKVISELANEASLPAMPVRSGPLKLLHVGRVVRTKGLRDVIRALALVPREITLTSAGEGPDLEQCRTEAEALGVADRVTFLGHIPRAHVEDLYRSHDVLAFPSFREPSGIVFLEAMRWGMPIIAARRGGAIEALGDSAHLIEVTTPEIFPRDIAVAIRALADDPAYRAQLSAASRARAAAFGGYDDRAREVTELYERVFQDREQRAIETLGDNL